MSKVESFRSRAEQREIRREALHQAIDIVRNNQSFLSTRDTEILLFHIGSAFVVGEVNAMVRDLFMPKGRDKF